MSSHVKGGLFSKAAEGGWTLAQALLSVDVWIFVGVLLSAIYIFFRVKVQKRKVFFPQIPRVAQPRKLQGEGKFEGRCRQIFERLFGKRFDKIRPAFLTNPKTGRRLELDGYNSTIRTKIGMGLAFEYDGRQHSELSTRFHRSAKDFVYQVQKDFFKDRVCRQRGIYLIRIPHTVKYKNLEKFITARVKEALK